MSFCGYSYEGRITVRSRDNSIDLWLGSDYAVENGRVLPLDAPVCNINGVTFVPMRFFTENLNCVVSYDGQSGELTVKFCSAFRFTGKINRAQYRTKGSGKAI